MDKARGSLTNSLREAQPARKKPFSRITLRIDYIEVKKKEGGVIHVIGKLSRRPLADSSLCDETIRIIVARLIFAFDRVNYTRLRRVEDCN